MRLIALAGLVVIEKMQLTLELAGYWTQRGQRVMVLDNIARLPIDATLAAGAGVTVMRRGGDLWPELPQLLRTLSALPDAPDMVLFAVSETASPEALFTALDDVRDKINLVTLALIDTRTCDCFPQIRAELERNAEVVVNLREAEPLLSANLIAQIESRFSHQGT